MTTTTCHDPERDPVPDWTADLPGEPQHRDGGGHQGAAVHRGRGDRPGDDHHGDAGPPRGPGRTESGMSRIQATLAASAPDESPDREVPFANWATTDQLSAAAPKRLRPCPSRPRLPGSHRS